MVGQTVNHYRIGDQLGAGGMGVVYRAEDLRLGRMVALKFLPVELSRDQSAVGRFEREARTASSLSHPNICTIYAFDEFEGRRFIAMELLDGQPLSEVITRPLPLDKVIEYGVQIADALDAAHGQGVLHRDIKPANIFVTRRGQIKVLDFGLAKLSATAQFGSDTNETIADTKLSMQGMAVGTVAYMSPEQARGEELDARSDLFSCGIVLYEMVTGQQAFQGRTSAIVFDSILNHMPAPLALLKEDIPQELERIISKALEKNRDFRYQTASGLRSDLHRLRRDRDSGRVPLPLSGATAAASGTHMVRDSSVAATAQGQAASGSGVAASSATVQAPVSRDATPASHPAPSVPAAPGGKKAARSALVAVLVIVLVLAAGVLVRRDLLTSPDQTNTTASGDEVAAGTPPASEGAASTATPTDSTPPGTATAPPGGTSAVAPAAGARPDAVAPSAGARTTRSAGAKNVPAAGAAAAEPVAITPELKPASPVDPGPTLLGVARAKVGAKLYDQAFTDLQSLVSTHATSTAAPAAYLLMGSIRELQTRPDDAMAMYVELRSRYGSSEAGAEGTVRLAQLLLRSKRPDRVTAARQLLQDVPARHAESQWAPRALALQAALEDREKMKARDPQVGKTAPASLATNRTLTERYPTSLEAELGFWHLSEAYDDLKRYDLQAKALSDLATRFPNTRYNAWWRAAEIYDRRLKDKTAAAAAYARVPQSSPNYKDAQKRIEN